MHAVEVMVNQSIYSTFIVKKKKKKKRKNERPNSIIFIQDSEFQLFVLFCYQDFKITVYNI